MSKYTDLITNYHSQKPLFVDHIDLITRPLTDVAGAMTSFITEFDIDEAIGVQLDILGKWIGRTRVVSQPISGIYFSFDMDGLGFDQGVWQGPYDPDAGFTNLSDDTYRIILKAKIAINHWGGTNETLPAILDTALKGSGLEMQIIDNQDMTVSIWVFAPDGIESVSLELLAAIRQGYLTVKAAGVYSGEILTPSVGAEFFGFDLENDYIAGFDEGAWGIYL
ncbi:DUF2612 domain-containing protein [Rahnella aquatilis]|uniref:DUF2612 domain-containing protein n=1 Tax=Rahnella perminowiae TaxID=2816244 RepID=A0ABS6L744_9GAMM|nr:DUF2612 domain-containing protein [Rahnella perminowiae]MBU9823870.1 DUF2612 domain-containing protein [Rahnella perminowiae]MBU9837520.1 DUF2612 domain-containing protein [Rahnella perminowiae]MCX2946662.1 DUF2612 domain-containing protein [Rahnella perminowiae]UJD90212.1 DUF2612 domain-containing protein [Rahnella aquatilis]